MRIWELFLFKANSRLKEYRNITFSIFELKKAQKGYKTDWSNVIDQISSINLA
jgi:hypothetical protein